jgi:hypothetical protein
LQPVRLDLGGLAVAGVLSQRHDAGKIGRAAFPASVDFLNPFCYCRVPGWDSSAPCGCLLPVPNSSFDRISYQKE